MESICVHQDSQSSFTVIDNKRVLTCAEDNLLALVDTQTQEIITGETNEAKWAIASQLQPLAFLRLTRCTDLNKLQDRAKSKPLIAIGTDKSVDIYSWNQLQTILGSKQTHFDDIDKEDGFIADKMVQKIAFSKDGKWIVASDCSEKLQFYKHAKKLQTTVTLDSHDSIRAFDLCVDGKHLLVVTFDAIYLIVLTDKKTLVSKKEIDYKKACGTESEDALKFNNNVIVSFSQDGKQFFLPLNNKIVRYSVSNVDEQEEIISIGTESIIMVNVSFDDKQLFVYSRNYNTNFLRMIDINNKEILESVETKSYCLDMKVFLGDKNKQRVAMNTDFGDIQVYTFAVAFVPQKELIRNMVDEEKQETMDVDEDMGEQEQKMERLRCVGGSNQPVTQNLEEVAAKKLASSTNDLAGLQRDNLEKDEDQTTANQNHEITFIKKAARNKTFEGTNQHLSQVQNSKKLMAWTTQLKVIHRQDTMQNVYEVKYTEIKRTNLCLSFPLTGVYNWADISDDYLLLQNNFSIYVRHLNTNDWWSFAFEECQQDVVIVTASVSNEHVFVQLSGKSEVRVLNAQTGLQLATMVCDRGVFKLASCNERTQVLRETPTAEVQADVLTLRGYCLFQLDKNIQIGSAKILYVGFMRSNSGSGGLTSKKNNAKRLLLHDSYGRVMMVNVVNNKMNLIPICSLPQNVFILGCEEHLNQVELNSFDDQPENAKFLETQKGAPTVEQATSNPVFQEIEICPEDANVAKQPQESSLGQSADAVEVYKTARLKLMQMEFERVCKGNDTSSESDQERAHDKTVVTGFKELLQHNELKLAIELIKSLKMTESFDIAAALLKVMGLECFLYKLDAVKEQNIAAKNTFNDTFAQLNPLTPIYGNNVCDTHDTFENSMDDVNYQEPQQFMKPPITHPQKPLRNDALENLKNASKEHLTEIGIKNNGFASLKNDFKRKHGEDKENRFMKL